MVKASILILYVALMVALVAMAYVIDSLAGWLTALVVAGACQILISFVFEE